jgi:predicted NACHT family NTPase
MRVPLLATLIIAVFRNPRLKKLPESKVRLYELFVELHSGGWDAAKNISRNSSYGSTENSKF